MFFLNSVWGLWERERNADITSNQAVDHIKDLRAADGSPVFLILS